jgi:hypothetical protein
VLKLPNLTCRYFFYAATAADALEMQELLKIERRAGKASYTSNPSVTAKERNEFNDYGPSQSKAQHTCLAHMRLEGTARKAHQAPGQ